jgi:two-component system CheB/CheR fusion protein
VIVEADPARLQQIVVNLLDNAAKYTAARYAPKERDLAERAHIESAPEGAAGPRGCTSLQLTREGSNAVFTVSDNGLGIEPALLDSIFEPFVQGATTIHRTEGGMGVGLSVVHALVKMHAGEISAQSDGAGRGSTFVVRLPLAIGRSMPASARGSLPWPAGKRVVVIEDNPDGAEMLGLLLEHAGYEVHTAPDGKLGMELIQRVKPDVALVDIGLPVMNGFELARWARAQPEYQDLYLLALTGYGQASDRAAALEAGFDEHLVKPVDAEELRRVMRGRGGPDDPTSAEHETVGAKA